MENQSPSIPIAKLPPEGPDTIEELSHETDDPDILGVGVTRYSDPEYPVEVFIAVAEFIRDDSIGIQALRSNPASMAAGLRPQTALGMVI